jgi:hypothetical protein
MYLNAALIDTYTMQSEPDPQSVLRIPKAQVNRASQVQLQICLTEVDIIAQNFTVDPQHV